MRERWRQFRHSRAAIFAVPILAMVGLLWLAISFHGWPIDAFTWRVLAVVIAFSALPGILRLGWRTAALVLLSGVYIAFPGPFLVIPLLERWSLCDDHGGRRGRQISPGLRFGHDGPNTKLLESYLGPLPPNWWQQSPLFPYIRDGDERVQSRNPIFRDYLPDMLARLPGEAARKQVLSCLVDPENRLRVHQALLLACLLELGYPPGLDAEGWWQAHRGLFEREHDAMTAAKLTRGWLRRIERLPTATELRGAVSSLYSAADYQERGSWGGHYDFGEAVSKLKWNHRPDEIDAAENVVWWPSAPEALFRTGRISDVYLIRYTADTSKASREPLYFRYSDDFFEWNFRGMVVEPVQQKWPVLGKLEFKLDGRPAEAPILEINDNELGVAVDNQVFRGLNKREFLEIFKD